MGNSGHNETDGTGLDESRLRQFERNRFFNGKLMTARDMQAEQNYHAGRFDTLTQHVTGEGIVCGLEVEIEPAEGTGDTPTAVVSPGLAFDSSGRPIIVADDTPEEIPSAKLGGNGVSVFIEHATCKTESVPVPGSEDACKEECDYNRHRETVDIIFERGPPGEQKPVPVDRVRFPEKETLGDDDTEGAEIDPENDALQKFALSYHRRHDEDLGEGQYLPCDTTGAAKVFLGHFKQQGGSWNLATEDEDTTEPRPYVYTNDMLYAGLVSHATDFNNPHDVSLGVGPVDDDDPDAQVGIDESEGLTGSVELTSTDGSITITPDPDRGTPLIDLRAESGLVGAFEEYYVFEKSLWNIVRTYNEIVDQAGGLQFQEIPQLAFLIVHLTSKGLADNVYRSSRHYVNFLRTDLDVSLINDLPWASNGNLAAPADVENLPTFFSESRSIIELEKEMIEKLSEIVESLPNGMGGSAVTVSENAISKLQNLAEDFGDNGVGAIEIAIAQDRVTEATQLLLVYTQMARASEGS